MTEPSQQDFESHVNCIINDYEAIHMLDYSAMLKPVKDILGEKLHIVLLEDTSTMRFWDDLIACVGINYGENDSFIPRNTENRRSTARGEYVFGELAGNSTFKRAWKRNPMNVNAYLLGASGLIANKYRSRVIEKRNRNFGFKLSHEMRNQILSVYQKSNVKLFDMLKRDPIGLGYFPDG